jgi:AraC-like DNA-binding protein
MKEEDFLYILPCEPLRPYISHYTITFPNKQCISDNYTVIPNASSTIVFGFDGSRIGSTLFGTSTLSNKVGEEANSYQMILIIALNPCGLSHFVKINQSELTDRILPLEDVDIHLYRRIYNAFETSIIIEEILHKIDCLFLSSLGQKTMNDELKLAVDMTMNSNTPLTVKELSQSVCYSQRHLNRIFHQYMGISPKSFSRLVRINKAIKLLKNPQITLAQVAQQTGFYDQPHFIHEFQSICSISPQQYLKNMSDFYNDIKTT